MATAPLRRTVGVLLTLLFPFLVVAGTAGAAHAEDGYRYWNYFHFADGAWTFSDKGVGQYVPKNGDVEGLRYGTSTTSKGVEPRVDLTKVTEIFGGVCNGAVPAGKKQVALVIDYGTEADADGAAIPEPTMRCATVPEKATTQQAVESVLPVRAEGGLLCAIDGYPATGCGEPVKNATVAAHEKPVDFVIPGSPEASGGSGDSNTTGGGSADQGGDLTWPLVGVGAAVVVIGGGALLLNKRRADA